MDLKPSVEEQAAAAITRMGGFSLVGWSPASFDGLQKTVPFGGGLEDFGRLNELRRIPSQRLTQAQQSAVGGPFDLPYGA